MTSIYLAGKIAPGDWRENLVSGLQDAWGHSHSAQEWSESDAEWPVLPNGVIGQYDYTGPYFTETCSHSTHGCPQGEHCVGSMCEGGYGDRAATLRRCLNAIDRSEIVFAWLSDLTAYGTLTEIGYAKGRGKTIIVASPEEAGQVDDFYEDAVEGVDSHTLGMHNLWFAFTLADVVIKASTPLAALKHYADLNPQLDSPIEEEFWHEYQRARPGELAGLKAQHSVLKGKYRIDFALPEKKIGIELDGHAYHSDPKTFTQDRARQRDLELHGWRIIRFSGREINKDVSGCVRAAAELVASFTRALH